MFPPAPGPVVDDDRLAHASLIFWPAARARMSVVPPAGNGTTMRIGLFGYCASALGASMLNVAAATRNVQTKLRRFMAFLVSRQSRLRS